MLAGLLFLLMLGLGSTLTIAQVFNVAKHPKGIVVGWLSQFGWMPLIATALVMIWQWNVKPAAQTIEQANQTLYEIWTNATTAYSSSGAVSALNQPQLDIRIKGNFFTHCTLGRTLANGTVVPHATYSDFLNATSLPGCSCYFGTPTAAPDGKLPIPHKTPPAAYTLLAGFAVYLNYLTPGQLKGITTVLQGCTPGGSTSNFYAYFSRGDVALSVCMTMASTLCAFGMMPALLTFYGGFILGVPVDSIPLREIAMQLALVVVPVFIGVWIRFNFNSLYANRVTSLGSFSGFVCIFIVIGLGLADEENQNYLFNSGYQTLVTTNALGLVGAILGYTAARIAGERPRQCRTIAFETGIQNGPLSIAIALASFPNPCWQGPNVGALEGDINASVIPLLYSLFISLLSPVIMFWFRIVMGANKESVLWDDRPEYRFIYSKEFVTELKTTSIQSQLEKAAKNFANGWAMRSQPSGDIYGSWKTVTYKEYWEDTVLVAKAFIHLGLEWNKGVSILGWNCPQWFIAEYAAGEAGGYGAGIYQTSNPDQVSYIVRHSESQIIVVDGELQLQKVKNMAHSLVDDECKAVIVMFRPGFEPRGIGGKSWKESKKQKEETLKKLKTMKTSKKSGRKYSNFTVVPEGTLRNDNVNVQRYESDTIDHVCFQILKLDEECMTAEALMSCFDTMQTKDLADLIAKAGHKLEIPNYNPNGGFEEARVRFQLSYFAITHNIQPPNGDEWEISEEILKQEHMWRGDETKLTEDIPKEIITLSWADELLMGKHIFYWDEVLAMHENATPEEQKRVNEEYLRRKNGGTDAEIAECKKELSAAEEGDDALKITKVQDRLAMLSHGGIKVDDCQTLIYTSGTTGPPKGCVITHRNIKTVVNSVGGSFMMCPDDVFVSYLPLSHIAEKVVSCFSPPSYGLTTYFACPSALKGSLTTTCLQASPSVFFGVPRVWEKIEEKMKLMANMPVAFLWCIPTGQFGIRMWRKVTNWAKREGIKGGYKLQKDWLEINTKLRVKKKKGADERESDERKLHLMLDVGISTSYILAREMIFMNVIIAIGLDRAKYQCSAAAPISKATLEYFMSLGIFVYEVFGMSELTGPSTWNQPGVWKLGSIGKCIHGCVMQIAEEDNELMFKTDSIMKEYFNNPGATRDTMTDTGFLKTGDIGKIDANGFISITDRKKEILITAGGENVAPTIQEGIIKNICGIENCVLVGDKQKFIAGLFTFNPVEHERCRELYELSLDDFENFHGDWSDLTYSHWISCKKFTQAIDKEVLKCIKEGGAVPDSHRLKKWVWVPRPFVAMGPGAELTPTMKLRRRVILKKYHDLIKDMYGPVFRDYQSGQSGGHEKLEKVEFKSYLGRDKKYNFSKNLLFGSIFFSPDGKEVLLHKKDKCPPLCESSLSAKDVFSDKVESDNFMTQGLYQTCMHFTVMMAYGHAIDIAHPQMHSVSGIDTTTKAARDMNTMNVSTQMLTYLQSQCKEEIHLYDRPIKLTQEGKTVIGKGEKKAHNYLIMTLCIVSDKESFFANAGKDYSKNFTFQKCSDSIILSDVFPDMSQYFRTTSKSFKMKPGIYLGYGAFASVAKRGFFIAVDKEHRSMIPYECITEERPPNEALAWVQGIRARYNAGEDFHDGSPEKVEVTESMVVKDDKSKFQVNFIKAFNRLAKRLKLGKDMKKIMNYLYDIDIIYLDPEEKALMFLISSPTIYMSAKVPGNLKASCEMVHLESIFQPLHFYCQIHDIYAKYCKSVNDLISDKLKIDFFNEQSETNELRIQFRKQLVGVRKKYKFEKMRFNWIMWPLQVIDWVTTSEHYTVVQRIPEEKLKSMSVEESVIHALSTPDIQQRKQLDARRIMASIDTWDGCRQMLKALGDPTYQQSAKHRRKKGNKKDGFGETAYTTQYGMSETSYGSTAYGGTSYGGTSYGGTEYAAGTSYGGTSYGGTSYGGTSYGGGTNYGAATNYDAQGGTNYGGTNYDGATNYGDDKNANKSGSSTQYGANTSYGGTNVSLFLFLNKRFHNIDANYL
eukprot:g1120.t1